MPQIYVFMKKLSVLTTFFCITVFSYAQVLEQFTESGIGNAYSTGFFVGCDGLKWNYVKARGNQQTSANGDKAISLNKAADACIFSDTIANGIKFVSFQYEQELTANCNASVFVNDSCVAILTTEGDVDVTNYFSAQIANAPENAVLRIQQNASSSGQLTIDDIYIEFAKAPIIPPSLPKPTVNQVVITEVMANPSPKVGLPEFEYVEFCNLGDSAVQCADIQLVIGNTICELPKRILQPMEYVCVISEKARPSISDTSRYIFLQKMPTITNARQTIALLHNQTIISSVTVCNDWHSDAFKADGGWSLEKIDIENFSETAENWTSARNTLGGTPGYENSVARSNPDRTSPTILSIQLLHDTLIEIHFSERIDIEQIRNFSIAPKVEIDTITFVENMGENVHIATRSILLPKTEYLLQIPDSCTDFSQNQFTENQYVFAATDSILTRKSICVNEILFNPKSGGSDFVELYNNSNSYFDLSQLYLSNGQSFEKVSESFRLFPPHTYAVVSPDAGSYQFDSQCDNAIFVQASLPSLPDDEGTILVLNRWEGVIDSVSYSKHWHSSYLTDIEGVSLEKIKVSLPSEIGSSWCSAAASEGYSTPGCENSQALNLQQTPKIVLESEVVTPNSDGQDDEMIIHIGNSERGMQCSATICAPSGRQIVQLANNQLLGTNDFIRWNCTENNGRLVPAGIYIVQVELLSEGKKVFRKKLACTILRE